MGLLGITGVGEEVTCKWGCIQGFNGLHVGMYRWLGTGTTGIVYALISGFERAAQGCKLS